MRDRRRIFIMAGNYVYECPAYMWLGEWRSVAATADKALSPVATPVCIERVQK